MNSWLKTALVGVVGVWGFTGLVAPAAAKPAPTQTILPSTPDGLTKDKAYSNIPWEGNTTGFYQHFGTVDDYLDANFGQSDVDFLGFVYGGQTYYATTALKNTGLKLDVNFANSSDNYGDWTFSAGTTTYKITAVELMIVGGQDKHHNDLLNSIVYSVDGAHAFGSDWNTGGFVTDKWNAAACKITVPQQGYDSKSKNTDNYKSKAQCPQLVKVAFYGTVVHAPEPASIALFTAGLVGLRLRRRKQQA
jgi:hypothetical protein